MAVLVTGGAGFIGSHLVDALLVRGDEVIVVDDFNDYYDPRVKRANLARHRDHPGLVVVEGDICDLDFLNASLRGRSIRIIVHLAARAGVRPSIASPQLYVRTNCLGTANILELARLIEVDRLVFASSSSVYGNSNEVPFREADRVDSPVSPYAATKVAGELLCATWHSLYGVPVTALRFFTVYGPRQRPDMAIHAFTRLIETGQEIPFFGDGSTERDYTFVTDILQGLLAAIDTPLRFEIINLGESRTTTLGRLVELLEEALGKPARRKILPMQPGDVRRTCADVSKARALLGYNPGIPIEEGIPRFVEWYRSVSK
ncbi:MAG: GDP-mannose 4,6-dehydratase [Planctomycetota bacterium]